MPKRLPIAYQLGTARLLDLLNAMEDAGFTHAQLNNERMRRAALTLLSSQFTGFRRVDRISAPELVAPFGWRYYTSDFSINAKRPNTAGMVMFVRDEANRAAWHKLTEDEQAATPLFVYGNGLTLVEAFNKTCELAAAIEDLA